ncbi:diguanylate cyclase [Aeromicrobium sp. S22]|uniref:GGDEF domain-containing protein n=1 Tax=Aeromicrobium sp. S22 TaxID=2662029 RepID=UPI00129D9178|nr:GGDEF domain-containing protein [Aeromicrobium sp. S22]MRK03195.1 diguanylate cyclase [Aeromicrobium sp. S22]
MTEERGRRGHDHLVPPSVAAARPAHARHDSGRAYPPGTNSQDTSAVGAELAATQALLRAQSADEVGAIVSTLVHDLGGALVVARYADPAMTVPVDVSLGLSEPVLPFADPVSVAAMRLGAILPDFLEAARLVISRLQAQQRRDEEATHDHLTGVLTRRAWMRRLSRAVPGDSVCLIDLDHFKAANDTHGHAAGDAALRAFGALLLRTFGADGVCGRYGGDEFVALAPRQDAARLAATCDRMRHQWEVERPRTAALIGLTIGVAEVDERGGRAALQRADAAMYDGKTHGRDRTVRVDDDAEGVTT